MSVFPDWRRFVIPQQRVMTGCIATGYEMILRAAGAQGIDFDSSRAPWRYEHLNLYGKYAFEISKDLDGAKLRPLRPGQPLA